LKDGGKLVENVDDILQELGHFVSLDTLDRETGSTLKPVKDPKTQPLLIAMGFDPVSVDQLVARLGLSAAYISAELLCLEIEGLVSKTPSGYVRLPLGQV
jgi:DNA processing protein